MLHLAYKPEAAGGKKRDVNPVRKDLREQTNKLLSDFKEASGSGLDWELPKGGVSY